MGMNIGGVEIGPDQPCRIVAEIGTNHNGSIANAMMLIRQCAEAGADMVKFQCYGVSEILALRGNGPAPPPWAGRSLRELYERAHTPREWFPTLAHECDRVGIPWFSSVFGVGSLALLKSLGCSAYKVAALDIDSEFARSLGPAGIRSPDQPVIASSRGERIEWADLTLHCPPGYPQDWSYPVVRTDADGLSYHGTDVLVPAWIRDSGLSTPMQMLEVHVQLDDVPSELDAHSSLTVSQLTELCRWT